MRLTAERRSEHGEADEGSTRCRKTVHLCLPVRGTAIGTALSDSSCLAVFLYGCPRV